MRKVLILISLTICGCIEQKGSSSSSEERTYEIFNGEDESDLNILGRGYSFKTEEANKLNTKGIELVKQNQLHKADVYFTDALKIEPDNPVILCNIGNLYRSWGKDKIALDYYRDAWSKSDSTYFTAAYNMGMAYCNIDEYNKSEDVLNYLIFHSDNNDEKTFAKYELIRVYINQGKCSKANELYAKIKSELDEFPEMRENRAITELRLENCE